jgi:DNA-binding MarR family transcriptional regulator
MWFSDPKAMVRDHMTDDRLDPALENLLRYLRGFGADDWLWAKQIASELHLETNVVENQFRQLVDRGLAEIRTGSRRYHSQSTKGLVLTDAGRRYAKLFCLD